MEEETQSYQEMGEVSSVSSLSSSYQESTKSGKAQQIELLERECEALREVLELQEEVVQPYLEQSHNEKVKPEVPRQLLIKWREKVMQLLIEKKQLEAETKHQLSVSIDTQKSMEEVRSITNKKFYHYMHL